MRTLGFSAFRPKWGPQPQMATGQQSSHIQKPAARSCSGGVTQAKVAKVSRRPSVMSQRARSAAISTLISALCLGAIGCGQEEVKYVPRGAASGAKASLPPAANLPKPPIKNGDTWTVWGASYSLRSRVHRKEVAGKRLSIQGYITKNNMTDAPECAVHKGGKADPADCKAPVPTFWLCDSKEAKEADCISVMGWA